MTWLLASFLIAHGVLHLAIWLPSPQPQGQAPFAPDHSALLIRTRIPRSVAHRLSVRLAGATTAAYVAAGLAVVLDSGWSVVLAAAGAVIGLGLKTLFFNRWLSVGILLDAVVLSTAVVGWPISLT